ncbi:Alpha/Beta hydrolase protein [Obelidium mucronatum]|nr:Alpha/Beta hydrolase protein [Obelidium mucronatum]
MPYVQVAEKHGLEPLNMYYEVHGTGSTKVVLIGGFGNICHQWDLQVDFFMQEPTVYSVCIFDNRGGGLSSCPKGRYRTHEMAMDVKDLMDYLHWHRFHVVGLSLGGMIAQELAHLCLYRVISLTLESTFAYFNGLPAKGYANLVVAGPPLKTVDEFASHVVSKLLFPESWLDLPAPAMTGYSNNREHMIEFMKERFQVTGLQSKTGRSSQQSAVITHSMSPKRLGHIKHSQMPVLVISGTLDDVIIQPESSIYLAKHLGGRLIIFEGAGHAIRLQFPDRHNALLKEHILASIEKENNRLQDCIRSSLAALRGVCGGSVYESRATAIKEELEREFRRNGGRHRLVVHQGNVHQKVNIAGNNHGRGLHRTSLSSLRRRTSHVQIDANHSSSSSLRNRNSRISLSSATFATSLHDLFAPTEVEPSPASIISPIVASIPTEHPSSSRWLSWLFPSLPPLFTYEREVVLEPVEFGVSAFVEREYSSTLHFSTISSPETEESAVVIERNQSWSFSNCLRISLYLVI